MLRLTENPINPKFHFLGSVNGIFFSSLLSLDVRDKAHALSLIFTSDVL